MNVVLRKGNEFKRHYIEGMPKTFRTRQYQCKNHAQGCTNYYELAVGGKVPIYNLVKSTYAIHQSTYHPLLKTANGFYF